MAKLSMSSTLKASLLEEEEEEEEFDSTREQKYWKLHVHPSAPSGKPVFFFVFHKNSDYAVKSKKKDISKVKCMSSLSRINEEESVRRIIGNHFFVGK